MALVPSSIFLYLFWFWFLLSLRVFLPQIYFRGSNLFRLSDMIFSSPEGLQIKKRPVRHLLIIHWSLDHARDHFCIPFLFPPLIFKILDKVMPMNCYDLGTQHWILGYVPLAYTAKVRWLLLDITSSSWKVLSLLKVAKKLFILPKKTHLLEKRCQSGNFEVIFLECRIGSD